MMNCLQVMVVPRAEASGVDALCEDLESPIPDTPISPVHQPQSTVPPCSATSSGLLSMISSARTRACLSGKLSHSSQINPSSATSQTSRPPTPQADKGTISDMINSRNLKEWQVFHKAAEEGRIKLQHFF